MQIFELVMSTAVLTVLVLFLILASYTVIYKFAVLLDCIRESAAQKRLAKIRQMTEEAGDC